MPTDEAQSGFLTDAPNTPGLAPPRGNFLLLGDNTYSYASAGTNLNSSLIGDLDTYYARLTPGHSYVVVTGSANLFGASAQNPNVDLLSRSGDLIARSSSGSLIFTAADSVYYIQGYAETAGFYGIRVEDVTSVEQNVIGETILPGATYRAALDYISDVDRYTFWANSDSVYLFNLTSNVSDLFFGLENSLGLAVVGTVTSGTQSLAFEPIASGLYTLNLSSNTFTKTGAYQFSFSENFKFTPTVPTYSLSASSGSISEGQSVAFTLSTTNVAVGTSVAYTISGVSSADIVGGSLSGSVTVGSNGQATISVPIAADNLTEGSETLTVVAQEQSASVTVDDTSRTPDLTVTQALSASSRLVSEGQSAIFTLSASVVAPGTSLAYTISGVSSADIVGGSLSGSVTVGSNGQATISVPIAADNLTEGDETLTVYVSFLGATPIVSYAIESSVSASITVSDTSRADTTPPTVAISNDRSALSTNQTALLTFTLSEVSTNFTVSDVAVSGGTLSNFSGSGTSYTATFTPTANSMTAGVVSVASGAFTDAAGNANADGADTDNRVTMSVNTTNVQYSLSAGASTYDEGQTATFSLSATGASSGSTVSYTVSGVTAADLTDGALSGTVVLGSGGRATVSLPIASDRLTEGNETLTVSVGSVSASATIRDTSTTPVSSTGVNTKTYTVASTQASVHSSDGGATWTVVTPSGTETLTTYERIRFSDKTIALDFDEGEAGYKAVTMIGAAFGKEYVSQYFGTGVRLFDSGDSITEVAQLIIDTGLIESMVGSNSNSAWVRHVYENVIGVTPDAFTEAVFKTYLDRGTYTRTSLLELAAGVDALETQIDLVGIRSEGIGYIQFG